ncbi:MAG: hypothetical protein NTU98_02630 [Bacteroidetes bacterium]|nr:hypothetical protein [Bacteroidota bacterium]
MKKLIFFIISLALLSACKQKIDEFKVDRGSADFSKFVAIGNSLTAGYADGALYNSGQLNSFPNILAGQFQQAGGGTFVQPMVESDYGVGLPGFLPKLILGYKQDCAGVTSLGPVRSTGTLTPFAPVGYPVDNFGVPGAKSFHILAPHYGDPALMALGMSNPYFVRFASSPATTVLADVMARNPTFFTMWLGDNDVLSYALSGGAGDTITSPGFFQNVMGYILQTVTAQGAKGVIATIPDVTSIPYFTTIPYNGLYLSRQSLVDSVNGAMAAVYHLPYVYQLGYNPFLMFDPAAPNFFKVRQMKPGEMVLLSVPQDSMKCYGMGIISKLTFTPWGIPNQFVLDSAEIANLKNNTVQYNLIIAGLANTFNLALVDMNAKMVNLQKGIVWDGIKLNADFVTGGAFSLDGIHMNPRGCAVAANYFIEAINAKYGSTISQVDITKYHGVIFP